MNNTITFGLIFGIGIASLIFAILLRLASHWVSKLDVPFGKALGLALVNIVVNGFLFYMIDGLPDALMAGWVLFSLWCLSSIVIGGAILTMGLGIRYTNATLVYVVSMLAGLGFVAFDYFLIYSLFPVL
jgi:hypothetical protein